MTLLYFAFCFFISLAETILFWSLARLWFFPQVPSLGLVPIILYFLFDGLIRGALYSSKKPEELVVPMFSSCFIWGPLQIACLYFLHYLMS